MSETVTLAELPVDADACELGSSAELAGIFRALGHPARLAIVKRLASCKEACCGEIVSALPLAQSTVSQHLQVLKDAGLLTCDTRGRNCHYHLDWKKLEQAEKCSGEFWTCLNTSNDTKGVTTACKQVDAEQSTQR
ncbi:MAG: metalloregulator ArsR/SmtB family transcription factor [Roseibium sp.]